MSDTWSSIQAHKKQLDSLRERLQRRRKQDPLGDGAGGGGGQGPLPGCPPRTSSPAPRPPTGGPALAAAISGGTGPPFSPSSAKEEEEEEEEEGPERRRGDQREPPGGDITTDPALERRLLRHLADLALPLPTDAVAICRAIATETEGGTRWRRDGDDGGGGRGETGKETAKKSRKQASDVDLEIESLLSQQSTKEQQSKKVSQEILELLNTTTAKEQSIVEKFRSRGRAQVQEFCDHGTKEECVKATGADRPCRKLHFRRIINKHTDETLTRPPNADAGADRLFPPQWICCDIRYLDVSILGKFAVVMADPPWDIHMELPYGTLTDDEMRRLNIPVLQDEGFLFLWVTGRAMELGRECLNLWGYERVDEIIWVKTNQLQRIIRTGRTGHWLKPWQGALPGGENRGGGTTPKPQGGTPKTSPPAPPSSSGAPTTFQPNWITLGNQLDGIHLLDPDVVAQFKQHYPDGIISKPKNM
ncbi:unnamed protein product [Bubo scandiacus]